MGRARQIAALGVISAGGLMFEIGMTRIFAEQQFYHFAFVVISLAVMGLAASGIFLSIRRIRLKVGWLGIGFSLSIAATFGIVNNIPFDSYSIAWDQNQIWILALYFLASCLPFLMIGWFTGACLVQAGKRAYLPYAAAMVGSGLGCPLALLFLGYAGPTYTLAICFGLGLLASALTLSRKPAIALGALALLIMGLVSANPQILELKLSPYKPLVSILRTPDAQTQLTRWSAASRIDIVESDSIHVFPGLSLNAAITPPEQAGAFIDGNGPLPITHLSPDDPGAQAIADHMPASLAYHLRPAAHALILRPGAGLDLLLALAAGAETLTTSLDNPLLIQILQGPYADYTHNLLHDPRILLLRRDARGALHAGQESYDIIQYSLYESFRPIRSGAFSLTENFILTHQSITQALERLDKEGILVITRWLGTPPSESARTWSTILAAMEAAGIDDPRQHLIALRGMRTATILVCRSPFTPADLQSARTFLHANAFDPIFLPDLDVQTELNRYNRLPKASYHQLFMALLDDPEKTIADYDFNIQPASDDWPFFYHFFRWRQTPEVLNSLGQQWQPFGGSGYLVLLILLVLMIALALPLALGPMLWIRQRPKAGSAIYFACLGAGYLMIEIPLIQRFTLLLGQPTIALATVLCTLLLASGCGSLLSPRLPLRRSLLSLVLIALALDASLPMLLPMALAWSLPWRVALCSLFLIPVGLFMGVPFASGLQLLEEASPGRIPWAWGVNGAASGVSGIATAMIALEWGLSIAIVVGALLYAVAAVCQPSIAD